jgi:hypothetical protein
MSMFSKMSLADFMHFCHLAILHNLQGMFSEKYLFNLGNRDQSVPSAPDSEGMLAIGLSS